MKNFVSQESPVVLEAAIFLCLQYDGQRVIHNSIL